MGAELYYGPTIKRALESASSHAKKTVKGNENYNSIPITAREACVEYLIKYFYGFIVYSSSAVIYSRYAMMYVRNIVASPPMSHISPSSAKKLFIA